MRLHLLYTAHLRANFDLMPRVFTLIQQMRRRFAGEPTLLLDLGSVWSAESWICQVTDNRAPYLILDAMGYNIVRADGLSPQGIMGLQEVVQIQLVSEHGFQRWEKREIAVNIGPEAEAPGITWVATTPAQTEAAVAIAEAGRLILAPLTAALGYVAVNWPDFTIIDSQRIPFNLKARSDPTIISAIEFVEREARYYAQKSEGRNRL